VFVEVLAKSLVATLEPIPVPRLARLADAWTRDALGDELVNWTRWRGLVDQLRLHPETIAAAISSAPLPSAPLLVGRAGRTDWGGRFLRRLESQPPVGLGELRSLLLAVGDAPADTSFSGAVSSDAVLAVDGAEVGRAVQFDTSALISLMERRPSVTRLVEGLDGPQPRSVFVYGELLHGLAVEPDDPACRRVVEMYELLTEWIPATPSRELSRVFGAVSALAARTGSPVDVTDRWIIAESVDLVVDLVTCDVGQAELASAYLDSIRRPASVVLLPT